MKFVGREKELAAIKSKLKSDRSESILLYGRRRVGKSELIKESLRHIDATLVHYVCRKTNFEQNLSGLSQVVAEAFDEPVQFAQLGKLLEYICKKARGRKVILVIDEYPFLRGNNEAIDSEFQITIDKWQHEACLKLILCGSYVEVMQKLIDNDAPLFGRFSEVIKLKPFDYYDTAKFFPDNSPEENILLYSVFGGIPFYLIQIDNLETIEENIKRLIIPEGSLLEGEIRLQLKNELSKEENANLILEMIANGKGKYSDIAHSFNSSNSNISPILSKLKGMGLIDKDSPINAASSKKQHRYVICDNVLDFYYSYLFKETSARSIMSPEAFWDKKIKKKLVIEYLPRKFEQVAKEYLIRENRAGRITPPFTAVGRYIYHDKANKQNGEFDVVTEDEIGFTAYECKYKNEPIGMKVVNEEKWQAEKLGIKFYQFGFFSKNGFSDEDVKATVDNYRSQGLSDTQIRAKIDSRLKQWNQPSTPILNQVGNVAKNTAIQAGKGFVRGSQALNAGMSDLITMTGDAIQLLPTNEFTAPIKTNVGIPISELGRFNKQFYDKKIDEYRDQQYSGIEGLKRADTFLPTAIGMVAEQAPMLAGSAVGAAGKVGKAQQLGLIVLLPGKEDYILPNQQATRGELALWLYGMLQRAAIQANEKIEAAKPKQEGPKKVDGYIIKNVVFDGDYAIIPAGTELPLGIMDCIYTKSTRLTRESDATLAQEGAPFLSRALVNFVSEDKTLLIPIGSEFTGVIDKVKRGTTLIKNSELIFRTENLIDSNTRQPVSAFKSVAQMTPKVREFTHNPYLQKIGFKGFKGHNFYTHKSQQAMFVLLEEVKIDLKDNLHIVQ